MLKNTLPYSDNPLFKLETRRVRWLNSEQPLWGYSLIIQAVVTLALITLWLLLSLRAGLGGSIYVIITSDDLINMLVILSIAANVLLDLACFWFTLDSIDLKYNPIWWDLLRITPLAPQEVITAKHKRAQMRVWWLMMLILSTRTTTAALILIHYYVIVPTRISLTTLDFLMLPALGVVGLVYIIEPFWRMRAITALGLWLSARMSTPTMTGLAGLAALLAVWSSQAGIFLLAVWAAFILLRFSSVISLACLTLITAVAIGFVIHQYYRRLQLFSLYRALQMIFSD